MIGCCDDPKWAVAWRIGELSQQPTWPQLWHTRRCTQSRRPIARQSSQPVDDGVPSVIWSRWSHVFAMTPFTHIGIEDVRLTR